MTRYLIVVIGCHSCVLGMLMLLVPRFMLALSGFSPEMPIFFPSQAGIFLVILGVCYLLAARDPALIKVILISKALAVVFLFTQAAFLDAPVGVWAAGGLDAAMLLALSVSLWRADPVLRAEPPATVPHVRLASRD